MAWLLVIQDAKSIENHAMRGALFETYSVSELIKQRYNAGQVNDLYFWRDNVGHEVNVLYETTQGLQAIEIKSGSTFASDWPNMANKWRSFAGEQALTYKIIYGGDEQYERQSCRLIGWQNLAGND